MKHIAKRFLAILLTLVLCVSLLPTAAFADRRVIDEPEIPVEEPEAPAEEPEAPAEEPEAPAEEPEEAPAEEPEAPADEEPEELPAEELPDEEIAAEEAPDEELPAEETVEDEILEEEARFDGDGGSCSADDDSSVSWSMSNTGDVTISGTGVMGHDPSLDRIFDCVSITVEEGVTGIAAYTLMNLPNLTTVTLPASMDRIMEHNFSNCPSLTTVNLSEGLTTISSYAFANCPALETVTLPFSLQIIYAYAFNDCPALTVELPPVDYCNVSGGAFRNVKKIITDEPMRIYAGRLEAYFGTATKVTVPGTVTTIGGNAFHGYDRLTSVTIPDSVTTIEYSAFAGCTALSKVSLPDSVTSLEYFAFGSCTSLKSLTLPENLQVIEQNAFQNSGLETLTVPGSLTEIPTCAFANIPYLDTVTVSEGIVAINPSAFSDCSSLAHLDLPSTLTFIGRGAFWGCIPLANVEIPENVTDIEASAFYNCKVSSLSLPECLEYVGNSAFDGYYCELEQVTLPASLLYAGNNAFYGGAEVRYPCDICMQETIPSWWTPFHVDESTNIVEPDCMQEGYTHHYCKRCGREYSDQYVPPLGHCFVNHECIRCPKKDDYVSAYGSFESGATWEIDGNCLYIEGSGAVECSGPDKPWAPYADMIDNVEIGPAITSVAPGTFSGLNPDTRITKRLVSGKSLTLDNGLIPRTSDEKAVWSVAYDQEYVTLNSKNVLKAGFVSESKSASLHWYLPEAEDDIYLEILPVAASVTIRDWATYDDVTGKTVTYNLRDSASPALTFSAVANPSGASFSSLIWTCSDKKGTYCTWSVDDSNLLEVQPSGTGKTGTVTFTASVKDGGKAKATVKVNFVKSALKSELKITNQPAVSLKGKKSVTLKTNIASIPGVTDKKVVWSVPAEDLAYASVSSSGKVTVKPVAQARVVTVIATAANNPEAVAKAYITLAPAKAGQSTEVQILVSDFAYVATGRTLPRDIDNGEVWLNATVLPGYCGVTWKSSNTKIATVGQNEYGEWYVTPLKAGTVTVTAKATDGSKASGSVKFVFRKAVKSDPIIKAANDITCVAKGKTLKLQASFPAGTTNSKVTWSVPDWCSPYISVSKSGVVTAKNVTESHYVEVYATSVENPFYYSCISLTVCPAATKLTILDPGDNVVSGKKITYSLMHSSSTCLTAAPLPSSASWDVVWKSSNTKIAKVDEYGTVTFLETGTVKITATTTVGTKKAASVTFVVKP